MIMKKNIVFSVAVFSAFGLAGPLIRRVFSAPGSFLILIWPALMFGSGGTAVTLQHDLAMTGVVNVVFFGLVGLIVANIATRAKRLLGIYLAVCALVVLGGAWGSGFSFAFFAWKDVAIALALYSLPFGIVWWRVRNHDVRRVSSQSV
jgi:hypothetical protein